LISKVGPSKLAGKLRPIWNFVNQPLIAAVAAPFLVAAMIGGFTLIKGRVGDIARSLLMVNADPPWPFGLCLVILGLAAAVYIQWRTAPRVNRKPSNRPLWEPLSFAGLGWEVYKSFLRTPEGDPRANAVRGPFCPECHMNLSDVHPKEIPPPVGRDDSYTYNCRGCGKAVGKINAPNFCAYPDIGSSSLPLDVDKLKIRVFEEKRAQERRAEAKM